MICPRDGAPLETHRYEGDVEVDACPTCYGIWLDAGELKQIERLSEIDHSGETPLDSVTAAEQMVTPSAPIDCPKCSSPMHSKEYGFSSQVVIDVCLNGCGTWLDKGELQRIEMFFERARKKAAADEPSGLWGKLKAIIAAG